jgi:hypothetical protein
MIEEQDDPTPQATQTIIEGIYREWDKVITEVEAELANQTP